MATKGSTEERVGSLIIEGQRHELWVCSMPDEKGRWHNTLHFRRDGIHSTLTHVIAGVDWHLPPGDALLRALSLPDAERTELYRRSLRPRPPVA